MIEELERRRAIERSARDVLLYRHFEYLDNVNDSVEEAFSRLLGKTMIKNEWSDETTNVKMLFLEIVDFGRLVVEIRTSKSLDEEAQIVMITSLICTKTY